MKHLRDDAWDGQIEDVKVFEAAFSDVSGRA